MSDEETTEEAADVEWEGRAASEETPPAIPDPLYAQPAAAEGDEEAPAEEEAE